MTYGTAQDFDAFGPKSENDIPDAVFRAFRCNASWYTECWLGSSDASSSERFSWKRSVRRFLERVAWLVTK
jgi:hypothetical protein